MRLRQLWHACANLQTCSYTGICQICIRMHILSIEIEKWRGVGHGRSCRHCPANRSLSPSLIVTNISCSSLRRPSISSMQNIYILDLWFKFQNYPRKMIAHSPAVTRRLNVILHDQLESLSTKLTTAFTVPSRRQSNALNEAPLATWPLDRQAAALNSPTSRSHHLSGSMSDAHSTSWAPHPRSIG